ncbi:amidohydrolase family protein [bacterium]|nr:amidohydrolase family protein [bacterium]
MYIVENARIFTGEKFVDQVIAISNGKVSFILPSDLTNYKVIEGKGKILAPGFIDVHTHTDGWLLKNPAFNLKTQQGYTTEVLMADGISYAPVNGQTWKEWIYYLKSLNGLDSDNYTGWESVADYMRLLDRKTCMNTAAHVPYANVRTICHGWSPDKPGFEATKNMQALIQEGLSHGAVGLSTGLEYVAECFSSTEEIINACRAFSGTKYLYVTHIRYPLGLVEGLMEAVEIGRAANVPVHISHLKCTDPGLTEKVLNYIDRVAVHEVDFSFDVYPYAASSTMLHYLLPYEIWSAGPLAAKSKLLDPAIQEKFSLLLARENLDAAYIAWGASSNTALSGINLSEYIRHANQPAALALSELLIEENFSVLLVFRKGNDDLVAPFVAHKTSMIGSDGIYFPGANVHPRMYGSSAKILGDYRRRLKVLDLETALKKLSTYPARRFGLKGRGVIEEGSAADLVLFDPVAIQDHASYDDSCRLPSGIEWVFVNGVPVVMAGEALSSLEQKTAGCFIQAQH